MSKRYVCDITNKEVCGSNYTEVTRYSLSGRGNKHDYLHDFNIEGYNNELEPELDKMLEQANFEAAKAKHVFIEKTLAKLRSKGK